MITPAPIKQGDKIRIVSPAGKLKKERVLPAVNWLREKGYRVELGKYVFSSYFQFSGTDDQRLSDLQEAFNDPDTSAIICARGGYGTVRIIEQLDFIEFKKHPKWLVGYSDITILHLVLNKLEIASVHGTMPPFFFDEKVGGNENLNSLMKLISGENIVYEFMSEAKQRKGKASGELIGGNLSIVTSLLGSKYEIETANKILFIEDIDEYLYQIDRMMFQLKYAGKLEKLAGLVVGDFTNLKDNDDPFGQTVEEIIWDAVKDYDFPVSFGLNAGHGDLNLALSFGSEWELNVLDEVITLATKF